VTALGALTGAWARAARVLTLGLVVIGSGVACGGHLQAFPRALADWRAGRQADAIAAARAECERWREGNDLSAAAVDDAVAALEARLDEGVPLVAAGEVAAPPVGAPADLGARLRADLLSNRVTPVVRALRSVAGLGLVARGPEVLTIVFRREPVEADGPLLGEASPAMRSVVTKRLALRALEQLAARNRPVL